MTQTINDNLQVAGDLYLRADNFVSVHYGDRGRVGGQTTNFNPDNNNNGLWLEASTDGSESGGIFCNGNTIVLWSPGNNDTLRVYDEDQFGSSPKFVINNAGNIGIGAATPQSLLQVGDGLAGGFRSWMIRGAQVAWDSDNVFLGLKDQGGDRKDSILAWGDNEDDAFRVIFVASGGPVDGREIMRFLPNGRVGIGTANPQAALDVSGDVRVNGQRLAVPDYVLKEDYKLRGLDELRDYIDTHKHLPEMPSAQDVSEEGVSLGQFCMSLLKKVEELSLYILQQQETIEGQNERIAKLERPTSL